jgi:glycosyltransferase involved in cell wall biosynthesis
MFSTYHLNSEKTLTIYNATPENKLSSLVQNYNAKYVERDKEIVYAGRFTRAKNVLSLVDAFAKLNDHQFKLLLIGEGPEEKNIQEKVRERGLQNRVEFMQPMSQSDLYYRIAHCYLVVIPSWTDISPQQVYECLTLGIPFLISEENFLSINAELPLTIKPGIVDDIAQTLNSLLEPETYKQFVEKEKNISYHHPWEMVVEEHLKVFMNLLRP